jgi:hypothetical protein
MKMSGLRPCVKNHATASCALTQPPPTRTLVFNCPPLPTPTPTLLFSCPPPLPPPPPCSPPCVLTHLAACEESCHINDGHVGLLGQQLRPVDPLQTSCSRTCGLGALIMTMQC